MLTQPITESGSDPLRFTLRPNPDNEAGGMLMQGEVEICEIGGRELVAYFEVRSAGWLFLTCDDNPFEEVVTVTLLDAQFKQLDEMSFPGPYVSGWVTSVKRIDDKSLLVCFPDKNTKHVVSIAPEKTGLLRRRTKWIHVRAEGGGS